MTQRVAPAKTGKVFYGWIALTGVALIAFVVGGTFTYSYGVFLPVMIAEFGWSRAVTSVGLTIGMLAFGLPGPLTGVLINKFGSRINMILGSLLSALGLVGMSLAHEIWHVDLFYGLTGLGAGVGGFLTCTTVANDWFIRKRSLAMGIFSASAGLGGFAFPAIEAVLISSIGWRMAWIVLAGIVFVAGSLIGGLILVRNRPEDMGQVPDGIPFKPFEDVGMNDSLPAAGENRQDWRAWQALRNPAFWLITAFGAANYFVLGAMIGHQVAYIQDLGFTPLVAAMTMSMVPGVGIIGRLGFGGMALRFNMKKLVIECFVMQLVGLFILMTTKNLALIYVYAALFGISNGAIMTALPTFTGTYYGRVHFAQIQGVVYAIGMAALAVAPLIAGAIYDATGTYSWVFIIMVAASFLGLVCTVLTRQPKVSAELLTDICRLRFNIIDIPNELPVFHSCL